jgi:predicted DNA-binding transcriptional regulator AlpA
MNGDTLLLDATGVATMLGVSRRHVQALDSAGKLPAGISLGRCKRWKKSEILAWIDADCPPRPKWVAMRGDGAKNSAKSRHETHETTEFLNIRNG